MSKFTVFWKVILVLLISFSAVSAQAQKNESAGKAPVQNDQSFGISKPTQP